MVANIARSSQSNRGNQRQLKRPRSPQPRRQRGDMRHMGVAGQAPGSFQPAMSQWDGGSDRSFRVSAGRPVDLIQQVEPDGKEGVARSRRRHCCFLAWQERISMRED